MKLFSAWCQQTQMFCFNPVAGILLDETEELSERDIEGLMFQSRCRDSVR